MATVFKKQNVPASIRRKLLALRGKLTGWILVHGLGRWLLAALGILVADMVLDRFFKMDHAQRLVMLMLMVIAALVYFGWKVIKPLLQRPNDEALIYEVENTHPELKESLISGYQFAGTDAASQVGVSPELVKATIEQGLSRAQQLDFGSSLDRSQNGKNWLMLLAGLGLSGMLALGITQTEFLKTWFNRNILLTDDQWPQATYLEIAGANDGKLVIPRGNDHRQLVFVTEQSEVQDVSVSLEIENPGGRTIHPMKPTGKLGGREHMFMFHNVSSPFRFRASGGDDVTEWVSVSLVEPPNIIELKLDSLFPPYVGIESMKLPGNGPHAVLAGSRLKASIRTNKPLSKAELKLDNDVYAMTPQASTEEFEVVIGTESEPLKGGEYRFELTDESGLSGSRPSKFKLTIKEDEPPKCRASLLGITGLVSSRAMLPTSYQVADDYGVTAIEFDMSWKLADDEQQNESKQSLEFKKFGLDENGRPIRTDKDVAVLDLLPMNLPRETSFRFLVAASDNQPRQPGIGRSQEFLLRIVSDEELRSDLLRREIEQRKAFDQAYRAQMQLATELQALAARRRDPGQAAELFDSKREAELIAQIRAQKGVGTAIDRIASRFEEFLVEVKNNRLDEAENEFAPEQRIETRFDTKIIQPIRALDQELISLATRHMDNCRLEVRDSEKLADAVEQAGMIHQAIIREMKKILNAMNDSEDFQQVVNDLLQLKDDSEKVFEGIEKQSKPKDVFDDADASDIFDDK